MPEGASVGASAGAPASSAALLFLHAQTSLHPGSGTTVGVVDLPVQRERHTQWPVIPGSSLKGVLREACRRLVKAPPGGDPDADPWIDAAFGPSTRDAGREAPRHAGALSISDARILAFPVRSLRGVFAWVTAPGVVARLNRDLAIAGRPAIGGLPSPDRDRAACVAGGPLLVAGDKLVLEEFEFTRSGDAGSVAGWVADHAVGDAATRERIRSHLVVLHDDDFTYFVRHATEVVARVGLDYARKTVRDVALFYQEFLPPETLFYAVVLASSSRREGDATDAAAILAGLAERLPPVIQIGGDETIGKGLCTVRLDSGTGKEARP